MAKRKFTLAATQEAELRAAYHQSKDANFSKRLLAVRLYGTGHPTQHILDMIGCSRTSLMEWVQRYQRDGVDGLREQRRGGNYYKLSQQEKFVLREQVQTIHRANCWVTNAQAVPGRIGQLMTSNY